ncbi:MAG TPA: XdhC/CoxI family protein [Chloroflexota bacterium]|nr:XdhC/CoxI family protein [Chloroflexota bacterium]
MLDLTHAISAALDAHRAAALTTIVATKGRPPVQLAAKMVVTSDGERTGSLGDAGLDERVLEDMKRVMDTRKVQVKTYELAQGQTADVFFELFMPPPQLVVVGAGHIAVPLAAMGKMLDYEVVVIDDRATFANKTRFPTADKIIVGDYEESITGLDLTPSTFVVLVTRGHRHDVLSLRKVIQKPLAYIGMIGSRRRVFAVLKLLKDEGVSLDDLAKVKAPIGIDIGAMTPAEISVCILAEIINVWNGGPAIGMSDEARPKFMRALQKGGPIPADI